MDQEAEDQEVEDQEAEVGQEAEDQEAEAVQEGGVRRVAEALGAPGTMRTRKSGYPRLP